MEDNPFDIRILDAKSVRLFHSSPDDAIVRLTLEGDRSWTEVRIARAFPFSDPDHYVGLRNAHDKDIGLLIELKELDAESRQVVDKELKQRYFTPQVRRVVSVSEQFGVSTWDVDTDHGPRRIIVRNIRESTYPLGPNRLMMTDTDGNRYEFPDVTILGPQARQVLARVL